MGIDASRQWHDLFLRRGATPQSAGKSGVMFGIAHFFFPILVKMDLQYTNGTERPQAWKVLPLVYAETFSNLGFVMLGINNPLFALGLKMTYNLGVEAVPDALRAVRRFRLPRGNGTPVI